MQEPEYLVVSEPCTQAVLVLEVDAWVPRT